MGNGIDYSGISISQAGHLYTCGCCTCNNSRAVEIVVRDLVAIGNFFGKIPFLSEF